MPIVRNGAQALPEERTRTSQSGRDGNGGAPAGPRTRAVASTATEQGQRVAGEARAQGQEVAAVATDEAREVAGLVREQATQLTQELSGQGRILYEETRQQVAEQAEVQTQALAVALHRWGDETQALLEGRPAEAGTVGTYARQCADRFHQAASEIEIRGVSGLVEEVGDLARRRPAAFLLGAALIGFGGGRLLRSGGSGGSADPSDDGYEAADGRAERSAVSGGSPGRSRTVAPASRRRAPVGTAGGRRHNPAASGGE